MKKFIADKRQTGRGRFVNKGRDGQRSKQQPEAETEEAGALTEDAESPTEDVDNTVNMYHEFREREDEAQYEEFCAALDEAEAENQ